MKKIKLILSVLFGMIFVFLITSCGENAHVHNLIEHERKEATCENDGYEAYVECTDCDYTTYKVIKAKGHDFDSNYLYNATKHYHKCKKCDAIKDENSHTFAWIIDKFATEDEIGIKHEKCNVCEYTRNENTIIDKLAHTHNMLHVVKVDKTCTKDGNIEYYHCSKCEKNYLDKNGDNEVTDVVIKASHEYGDYHEEINATCSKEGTKGHYECSECHNYFDANKNKLNSLIIEKKPHDYKWVIDKPATEEEFGLKHEECNVCHYTRNENTIIVKLNHTHNMEHVLKIDKTCTSDGNIEYYHCSKCNKNYLDVNGDNEVVDVVIKASHEYGSFINEVASTCSKEGIKGHYECSVCHSYFDANKNKLGSIVIAKKDHDLVHHEKLESTCSSIGYEAYDTCKNCDYTTYKVIEKKPHDYKWVIDKPATEDETGLKHEECSVCHYTRNKNTIIDKLAHIHNMKHITKVEKTCTSDGNIEYYHCNKCNKNYLDETGNNEVIDVVIKASHEYGSFINEVASTCTSEGTKGHYECSACHNYFDANKNKLDSLAIAKEAHVYKNEWSHNENTHYHECKVCNNKKEISSHNYITNYEGYDKCSVCDYEDKRCKVYFDVDGGEQINTQKYEYKTIISLPVPKKFGYYFVGWEYNNRLYNKIEVNKNITLKAIWTKGFRVKLLDDGTVKVVEYIGNNKIVKEFPKYTTVIGESAFEDCSYLASITIPNSVTSIGGSAFSGCSSITSITLPNSVTSIGRSAFSGCSSLTSITLPFVGGSKDSNMTLSYIFGSIPESLKEVKMLEECTSIGDSAFYNCSSLESIEIPNSVTSIENSAFFGCSSLTSITLPFVGKDRNSYGGISWIFGCPIPGSLRKVIILEGCTNIGERAFYNCSSLTNIEIPNSVTSIGKEAFYNCSSLTNIELPNSLTSIGEKAFYKCSSLTNIEIPNSVTSIGYAAFLGCDNLISIKVDKHNKIYDSRDNCNAIIETASNTLILGCVKTIILTSMTSIGDCAFSSCRSLTSVVIPNSVTSIGDCAFSSCRSLTSVVIPNGVTNIGEWTFYNCSSLTNIVIPNSVTSIGERAFDDCSSLTNIEIPNSVTSIGNYAFWKCRSLTSIEIPNSVTSIGLGTFKDCNNLKSMTLPFIGGSKDSNTYLTYIFGSSSQNQYFYVGLQEIVLLEECTSIEKYAFYKCTELRSIIIPTSVTSIGEYAFYDCVRLTSIEIPSSVTSIGGSAFEKCSSLESITLPFAGENNDSNWRLNHMFGGDQSCLKKIKVLEGCVTLWKDAFSGCDSLTNIELPNSLTSIGEKAFYKCSSLTNIEIPNSVTSIGKSAFSGCGSLKNVVIPSCVESIGESAFSGCSSLTNIEIPNSVTSIGKSAFSGCGSLKNVVIPSCVESIGESAFSGCSSLTNMEIPNSVTSIGKSAFKECSGLITITLPFVGESKKTNTNLRYILGGVPMKLEKVILLDGCTSIENDAFAWCSSLTSIRIPNSVTSIGSSAFYGCSSLTSIEIPNSVTSIGAFAFYGCSSLTSVFIPSSVDKIGESAFLKCSKYYTKIYCEASSKPEDWFYNWNSSNCTVIWGYKKES